MVKDEKAKSFTNYITIVVQFFWILLALVGGAKVIAEFGILSYPIALIITAGIILTYLLLSGYKAIILTDIIQAIIILAFLILIVKSLVDVENIFRILSFQPEQLE